MIATEAAHDHLLAVVPTIERVAVVSVHTSPLTALGSADAGGLTVYVMALAHELARSGVSVDIFTRRFDPCTPEIVEVSERVRVISITAGPAEPVLKNDLFCYLADFASEMALFSLRNGVRYDVIHSHYWLSGWVAHLLKRFWNAPTIHMYHTLGHLKNAVAGIQDRESPLRLNVERELLGLLDQFVAPNPDERAELVWGLGARDAKICTIPPGIDLDRFYPEDPGQARRKLGLPDNPLVLFVGRIDPIKDVPTLLAAFGKLRSGSNGDLPPKLLIIGGEVCQQPSGPVYSDDLQNLVARATELGFAEDLILPGSQPQHLLPCWYSAATVCVMPSLYESFGLVVVEAMACGLPVIATRVGGMKFTVEEEISGLLVPRQDPDAMAAALQRIISDADFRATLQIGARQAAIRFSWHTVGAAMLNLYERLAGGDRENLCCYGEIYAS